MSSKSGIYVITNLITGKKYIGQSVNLASRLAHHKCDLKAGRHHNTHLQRSFNKHGIKNFIFEVLEYVELGYLDDKERYYISKFVEGGVFNKDNGGNVKKILSETTKAKIRAANLGKVSPQKGKPLLSMRGRVKSEQERKNISAALKGRKLSEATKDKIRNKALGRPGKNKRSVINLSSGFIFNSILEAAQFYQINYTQLSGMLSGSRTNKTNLRILNNETSV